jgi:hypothetical protein
MEIRSAHVPWVSIRPRPATLYWKVTKRARATTVRTNDKWKAKLLLRCGSSKRAELPGQAYLGICWFTHGDDAACHGSWTCLLVRGEPESSEIVKGLRRTTVELVFFLGFPRCVHEADLPTAGRQRRSDWMAHCVFLFASKVLPIQK